MGGMWAWHAQLEGMQVFAVFPYTWNVALSCVQELPRDG